MAIRSILVLSVLLLGLGTGRALAQPTTGSQVQIDPNAQYDIPGLIHVGLKVRCSGGPGTVTVRVTQSPPENPTVQNGVGSEPVVCDGQTHAVGVSIGGGNFDAGKATATATLTAPSGNDTATRTIDIKVI
jgi:hypothetical protein